jgi:hypothetical protein
MQFPFRQVRNCVGDRLDRQINSRGGRLGHVDPLLRIRSADGSFEEHVIMHLREKHVDAVGPDICWENKTLRHEKR